MAVFRVGRGLGRLLAYLKEVDIKDYIQKLETQKSSLARHLASSLNEAAPQTQEQEVLPRIFEKGLKPDLAKIGNYKSDKYKAVRRKAGLQVAFIDMKFTGDLKSEFSTPKKNLTGSKPKVEFMVVSELNTKKVVDNEARRGTIFGLASKEKAYFVDLLTKLFFSKVFK